jgi:hypothetical protein
VDEERFFVQIPLIRYESGAAHHASRLLPLPRSIKTGGHPPQSVITA